MIGNVNAFSAFIVQLNNCLEVLIKKKFLFFPTCTYFISTFERKVSFGYILPCFFITPAVETAYMICGSSCISENEGAFLQKVLIILRQVQ